MLSLPRPEATTRPPLNGSGRPSLYWSDTVEMMDTGTT